MGTGELEHELLLAETELRDREAEGASVEQLEVLRAKVELLRQRLALETPQQGTLRALSVGVWVPLPMYAEPPDVVPVPAGEPREAELTFAEAVDDEGLSERIRGVLLGPGANPLKAWRLLQLKKECAAGPLPERLLWAALASVGQPEGPFAAHDPLLPVEPPVLARPAPCPLLDESPHAGDGLTRAERLTLENLRDLASASRPPLSVEVILANADLRAEPPSRAELETGLVRLSQLARARFPLVEVDAAPPTRARLTSAGEAFLQGRLALPLLLIDGFVGTTTRIPPHHPAEMLRAACYVLVTSGLRAESLPLGNVRELLGAGTLVGPELEHPGVLKRSGIWPLWVTGRGLLQLEATVSEEVETGGIRARLVVTDFPERKLVDPFLVELATRRAHGDFPGLSEVRDESTNHEGRVVLTVEDLCFLGMTRRALVRAGLLSWQRAYDFTALDEQSVPRRFSLDELLVAYLRWRRDVLNRERPRTLERLVREEHAAEALYVAVLLREAVLEVLRGAATDEEAAAALTRFLLPAQRELLSALPYQLSHDYESGFTPEQAWVVARAKRLHARSVTDALRDWERARAAVAEERVSLESEDVAIDTVMAELRDAEQRLGFIPRRTLVRGV